MARYFGGRFGNSHVPTATAFNTKCILSMRDHYYMKNISGGGLVTSAANIDQLNLLVNWNFLPNYDNYNGTGFQATNYNGSKFRITNGNGTFEFNSYEYPCYGKFDIRGGDVSKDCFFQLYDFHGIAAQFNQSGSSNGNMFQMGLYWESSPNTDSLTNTLEATNAVSSGNAAYFVTSGYGNKNWSFYDGGGSSNDEAQSGTNREAVSTINWTGEQITVVGYGENAGGNSRKVKIYQGNTLLRTMGATINSGRPLYIYVGAGYPNGLHSAWTNGKPKFRYGNLSSGLTFL